MEFTIPTRIPEAVAQAFVTFLDATSALEFKDDMDFSTFIHYSQNLNDALYEIEAAGFMVEEMNDEFELVVA